MSATYQPLSGIYGSVVINGITLCVDSFSFSEDSNIQAAPSFCGAPYMDYTEGLRTATYRLSGTWNFLFNPMVTLKIGRKYSVILRLHNQLVATGTGWLKEFTVSDDVDGKVNYSMTLIADSAFTDFSGANA